MHQTPNIGKVLETAKLGIGQEGRYKPSAEDSDAKEKSMFWNYDCHDLVTSWI